MKFDKPKISFEDIEEIAELFFDDSSLLGKPNITDLGGIPNNNFRFTNDVIDVVFKIYSNGQSSINHIEQEIKLIQVVKKELKTLDLISGLDFKYLQSWNGYQVACSRFIKGECLAEIEFTEKLLNKVGNYISDFCLLTRRIETEYYQTESLVSRIEYVFSDISKDKKYRGKEKDILLILHEWEKIRPSVEEIQNSYELNPLHMDMWPYNFILDGESLYLVDFDDWILGPTCIEVAAAIMEFCMFESDYFNLDYLKAMLGGFNIKLVQHVEHLIISMKYLCVLWYGYNFIESDNYADAEVYLRKLISINSKKTSDMIVRTWNEFCHRVS